MTDRNQKLADLLQSWMDEDKAVRAELEALRAIAEAADAWRLWEWDNPTPGYEMSLQHIDETTERLQHDLRSALAKWKALTNECDDLMCEVVLDD